MNVPVPPEHALCISTCLLLVSASAAEENRLHVFAANFADEAHVGMNFLHRRGHRHNFLNHFPAHQRRNQPRARTRKKDAVLLRSEVVLLLHPVQEVENFFRLLGVVAFVGLPEQFPGRPGNRVLAGRAAHVEPGNFSRAPGNIPRLVSPAEHLLQAVGSG